MQSNEVRKWKRSHRFLFEQECIVVTFYSLAQFPFFFESHLKQCISVIVFTFLTAFFVCRQLTSTHKHTHTHSCLNPYAVNGKILESISILRIWNRIRETRNSLWRISRRVQNIFLPKNCSQKKYAPCFVLWMISLVFMAQTIRIDTFVARSQYCCVQFSFQNH